MGNKKTLIVALVGEPNAGKSTLINALVGQKISIVTHKVQTTRHNIRGVVNDGDVQLVFIDTPGLFEAKRTLERAIVRAATSSFEEADVVCVIFDVLRLMRGDYKDILHFIKDIKRPVIGIINKIDLVTKEELLPVIAKLDEEKLCEEIVPLTALKSRSAARLVRILRARAQVGEWLFDEEEVTDQPLRNLCEEITREQAFLLLHQELPYSLKVETEQWEEDDSSATIHQALFVMKESQKVIAVGRGGSKIKEIGRRARFEMGKLLGKKVHLYLYIKVREDWVERDFDK